MLKTLGSESELQYWLKHYGTSPDPRDNLALVKVSSDVMVDQQKELCEAISFLRRVGICPVLCHGGQVPLVAALEEEGLPSEFHGTERVTDTAALRVARRVFEEQSLSLINALEAAGSRARPVPPNVFNCSLLDFDRLGYVGNVESIDLSPIYAAIEAGCIPVLAPLGETDDGQLVTVRSDRVALEIARGVATKPLKAIYLSKAGALLDHAGERVSTVNLTQNPGWMHEVDDLESRADARRSDSMSVAEAEMLLDALPQGSTLAFTNVQGLIKELFTHRGSGTLFHKPDRIVCHKDLGSVDVERLSVLLAEYYGRKLTPGYIESLERSTNALYISENYRSCAIVTNQQKSALAADGKVVADDVNVPYLCKFAVLDMGQGLGAGDALWETLTQDYDSLFWRSSDPQHINSWFFRRADGSWKRHGNQLVAPGPTIGDAAPDWQVFWYGVDTETKILDLITAATQLPSSLAGAEAQIHDWHDTELRETTAEGISVSAFEELGKRVQNLRSRFYRQRTHTTAANPGNDSE